MADKKKSPKGDSRSSNSPVRTVPSILKRKGQKSQKLVALTAYDFTFAQLLDSTGEVDVILVGDSLGSVVQGHKNTIPVTLEEVCYHTRCVVRGVAHALVVADMPFMSFQVSPEQALQNAGTLLKNGGAQAVKLEGGRSMHETIARLVAVDIPVMGHVGLTPQSYNRMGGHKIQGRSTTRRAQTSADEVFEDALAVEDAGAFAVVLEGIPAELAARITSALSIPTIGIGAGNDCDGQILVTHDLLGLQPDFSPKFVKRYREMGEEVMTAVREYASEVRSGEFPSRDHAVYEGPDVSIRLARKS
ncbi:MAG: 3-methyl-2-oxobutanoate hydroxymethyltransferase [Bdellovibrionales bacterium]|nr:3-methyl-2-oxobutanoate hydroxymethyltransferase [Bdellovibrionales bacterium]